MLSNVLPGLREVRAPLAGGFLWLLVIWAIANKWLQQQVTTEPWASITQLSGVAEGIGATAALGFAAYLLGSVFDGLYAGLENLAPNDDRSIDRLVRLINRRGMSAASDRNIVTVGLAAYLDQPIAVDGHTVSGHGEMVKAAKTLAHGQPTDRVPQLEDLTTGRIRNILAKRVIHDRDMDTVVLLSENERLYGEIDRAEAEARFRVAVAAPLMVLGVVLPVAASSSIYLTLLAAGVALLFGAWTSRRKAIRTFVPAILRGLVKSGTLEDAFDQVKSTAQAFNR